MEPISPKKNLGARLTTNKAEMGENAADDHVLSRRMASQFPLDELHDANDQYMRQIAPNIYDENNNPEGIINLGTAFSYICEDLMEEQLNRAVKNAIHVTDSGDRQIWHPPTFQGNISFRRDLASFFSTKLSAQRHIDPENLVLINGTTSSLDTLAHCIADPGDVILIPTPAYTYLIRNVNLRAQVDFQPIDLAQRDETGWSFILTADKVEKAITDVMATGKRVRGLILVNPNNPLGDVYGPELVTSLLQVCARYKVHAILDEIHSLTVFDETTPFRSAVSYQVIPDPARTHILWSFSKDFCAPGVRMCIIYTKSELILKALLSLSCIFAVPNLEQRVCSQIISDTAFLDGTFFPTHLQRLQECHRYVARRLTSMGVGVRRASSGFVLMADFSKFLPEQNAAGERHLLDRLINAGVYITPGYIMYCSAPGWYRVVVSKAIPVLKLAMDRIEKVLHAINKDAESVSLSELSIN